MEVPNSVMVSLVAVRVLFERLFGPPLPPAEEEKAISLFIMESMQHTPSKCLKWEVNAFGGKHRLKHQVAWLVSC